MPTLTIMLILLPTLHTVLSSTRKSNSDSCCLGSCQTKTDLDWLRNHVKVVGERKILAIFVAVKLYSMAEMIQKENEKKKKKKSRRQLRRKKIKSV